MKGFRTFHSGKICQNSEQITKRRNLTSISRKLRAAKKNWFIEEVSLKSKLSKCQNLSLFQGNFGNVKHQ